MSGASPPLRQALCSSSITCTSSTRTTISRPRSSIFPTSWCYGRSPRPGGSPAAASATRSGARTSSPCCARLVVPIRWRRPRLRWRCPSSSEGGVEPLRAHVARVREERRLLTARLDAAGLLPRPSQANFVLVECGPRAASIHAGLAARGVLVRNFPDRRGEGLETTLRITLPGHASDFERLSEALERTLDAEGLEP